MITHENKSDLKGAKTIEKGHKSSCLFNSTFSHSEKIFFFIGICWDFLDVTHQMSSPTTSKNLTISIIEIKAKEKD